MILKTLFRLHPSPISDPGDFMLEALSGGVGAAGVVVNAETALEYPAVFRGVSLLAGDVAKLPLVVYERLKGGGKDRATSHPAYKLLRYKPNEFQTANVFRELLQAQAILWGNGYAFIERAKTGAPGALLPLDPSVTRPFRKNRRLWYETLVGAGERIVIEGDDVFHIMGLPSSSTHGLAGVSVIQKAKEALGLGIAAQQFGARFFSNDTAPRVVLEHPGKLDQKGKENIREGWERMHRGVNKSHRTAILTEGMKLNAYSVHPEDAQLLQTREHEIRATVANFLGLPPHMLGDNSRTAYNSLEMEVQGYLDRSLDPWLVKWEFQAWDKLLTGRQQGADSHVVEFVRAALSRTNLKDRYAAYAVALTNGIMNLDEVRSMENLNPIPAGLGSDFRTPMNLQVIGEDPPPPPAPPADGPVPDEGPGPGSSNDDGDDGEDDGARQQLLTDAVGRIVKRLAVAAGRVADRATWLGGEMPPKHRDVALAILGPVLAVCLPGGISPADGVADIWTRLEGDPSVWRDAIPSLVVETWRIS